MANFEQRRNEFFNKLKSNKKIFDNFMENCKKICSIDTESLLLPDNEEILELSEALYTYFYETDMLENHSTDYKNLSDNIVVDMCVEIVNRLNRGETITFDEYTTFDAKKKARIAYDSFPFSSCPLGELFPYLFFKSEFKTYYSKGEKVPKFTYCLMLAKEVLSRVIINAFEINILNNNAIKETMEFLNEFHRIYEARKAFMIKHYTKPEITKENMLSNWPSHTSKINKEREEEFIKCGLVKDEELNVYVHPEFGAFFYNTSSSSVEEEVENMKNFKGGLDMHCYVPQDVFMGLYDSGYEFVLGPRIDIFGKPDSNEHGLYCKNYREVLNKTVRSSK